MIIVSGQGKACTSFLFLALLVTTTLAQNRSSAQPSVFNLDDIVREIVTGNANISASRLSTRAASLLPSQVSDLPDPALMFSVLPFPIHTARGSQRSQLRVEQMFPYPGKLGLQRQIAELSESLSSRSTEVLEQDLVLSAKRSYFELARIAQQKQILLEFQDRILAFERIATSKYEVGSGTQQAILKSQLERNRLSDRILILDRQQLSHMEHLADLMNRPAGDDFELRFDSTASPVLHLSFEQMLDMALDNRPEARSLSIQGNKAQLQTELARKQLLPDFGINLTYFDIAKSSIPPNSDGRDALAIGITVKLPIRNVGRRARIEESLVAEEQLITEYEALSRTLEATIRDLTQRIRSEGERFLLYDETLVPTAETGVAAALSSYSADRTDFLALLDSERMLFEIRMQREEARGNLHLAIAMLERALGIERLSDISTP